MHDAPTRGGQLLRTGEAARILGCSRQHVVDLCESGRLPFVRVGTHRRVARAAVERVAETHTTEPTRDDLQSLWLHRAIAGELVRDPEGVLAQARATAERFLAMDPPAGAVRALRRWMALMDRGVEAVLHVLTSPSLEARDLRQVSPFVGILSERERQGILRAFRQAHERSGHEAR
jgi:excisionase family DNA binding protein